MTRRAVATGGLLPVPAPPGREAHLLGEVSRTLQEFRCRHVVLDAAVTPALLTAWTPMLTNETPAVAAVHAPCPAPEAARSGSVFDARDIRLAALDRTERTEALALIRSALDTACLLGAGTVVIEGGLLPLANAVAALAPFASMPAERGPGGHEWLAEFLTLRDRSGASAVDGLSFAIEALIREVEDQGLQLAVSEQRGPAWAGSLHELARVLDRFAGAPVVWWADPVGRHATTRLCDGSGGEEGPTQPPAGVWWRLPQADESPLPDLPWAPAGSGPETDSLHVLAPDGGRVRPWHGEAWAGLLS